MADAEQQQVNRTKAAEKPNAVKGVQAALVIMNEVPGLAAGEFPPGFEHRAARGRYRFTRSG
ncbi:hypothetical protein ABT340_15865 [Streptosporangium sp. NPDC000239]|uniref:hypothetical protein n=1 Tax=Streptosporangium sp. NPDC000239 TaxID=3154248 RepID=UPI0033183BE6